MTSFSPTRTQMLGPSLSHHYQEPSEPEGWQMPWAINRFRIGPSQDTDRVVSCWMWHQQQGKWTNSLVQGTVMLGSWRLGDRQCSQWWRMVSLDTSSTLAQGFFLASPLVKSSFPFPSAQLREAHPDSPARKLHSASCSSPKLPAHTRLFFLWSLAFWNT